VPGERHAALLDHVRATLPPVSRTEVTAPVTMKGPADFDSSALATEYDLYLSYLARCLPPGVTLDRSRADYAIARRMLAQGFSVAEVTAAILHGDTAHSKNLSAAAEYARHTVAAAPRAMRGSGGPARRR
jgi:hypothetical protein